jgi:hypothetical protein
MDCCQRIGPVVEEGLGVGHAQAGDDPTRQSPAGGRVFGRESMIVPGSALLVSGFHAQTPEIFDTPFHPWRGSNAAPFRLNIP